MSGGSWPALLAGGALLVLGLPRPGPARIPDVLGRAGPTQLSGGRPGHGGPADIVQRVVRSWPPAGAALPIAAAVIGWVGEGIAGSLAAMLLGGLAQRSWARRARLRTREVENGSLIRAFAALAAELRAGAAPTEALQAAAGMAVGPGAEALTAATAAARLGGDVPSVLLRPIGGAAAPLALRALAACWQVCVRAGSGLAAAVEQLAEGLRATQEQQQAVAASLAGPRASAGLLALLPLAGIALAAGLGARPIHVLLHTPVGLGCLCGGVGLDLLGLRWTRWIVDRAGGGAT